MPAAFAILSATYAGWSSPSSVRRTIPDGGMSRSGGPTASPANTALRRVKSPSPRRPAMSDPLDLDAVKAMLDNEEAMQGSGHRSVALHGLARRMLAELERSRRERDQARALADHHFW